MRSKLVQEIKSITCEKRVRPAYMVTSPRSKNKNRVRDYHRNRKSTSRCHQKKHRKNPYAASLSCKIALNEPDSSDPSRMDLLNFPRPAPSCVDAGVAAD